MAKSQSELSAEYEQRNRDKGHVQVRVWVPESYVDRLKGFARLLREMGARDKQQEILGETGGQD